jgi:CheY-like chemotaxis protein
MDNLELLEQLRKDYDLDNEDIYMIMTGQDKLENILNRREQNNES